MDCSHIFQKLAIDSMLLIYYNKLCNNKIWRFSQAMKQHTFSCGELMKRINDKIEKNANSKLLSYNITVAQFQMLVALELSPEGSATLKDLEKFFGVAQSTAAGIAVRLENKNLISSFTDTSDKRIKHLKINDSGLAICRNVKECIIETEQHLLSGLTPEELQQLNQLLLKIYHTLES